MRFKRKHNNIVVVTIFIVFFIMGSIYLQKLFEENVNLIKYGYKSLRVVRDFKIIPAHIQGVIEKIKDTITIKGKTPIIISDIDETLIPKQMLGYTSPRDLKDWKEVPYKEEKLKMIYEILRETKLVLISGNSRAVQTKRIVTPLINYIKEKDLDMDKLSNLTMYFDGGALKITYDDKGNASFEIEGESQSSPGERVDDKYEDYNSKGQISEKEIETIENVLTELFQSGEIVKWLKKEAEEQGVNKGDVIKKWRDYFNGELKPRFGRDPEIKDNIDISWLKGATDFKPRRLNSDYVEQRTENITGAITFPWIELRDGVQVTIKRFHRPNFKVKGKNVKIDIRDIIIKNLRKKLGEDFKLKKAGSGSIDINKGRDKKDAVENFIASLSREDKDKPLIYFGDEFKKGKNDLTVTGIEGLNIVSVGNEKPEKGEGKFNNFWWTGGGPYASPKIFEKLGLYEPKGKLDVVEDVVIANIVDAVEENITEEGRLDFNKVMEVAKKKKFGKNKQEIKKLLRDLMTLHQVDELFDVWKVKQGEVFSTDYLWKGKKKIHKQSQPLWHRNSHMLIVNPKGEILITLRAKDKQQFPNCWEILGGHLRTGEDFREGAIREISEEVGIDVNPDNLEKVSDEIFLKIGKPDASWGYKKNTNFGKVFQYKTGYDKDGNSIYNYELSKLFIYRVNTEEEMEKIERYIEKSKSEGEIQEGKWVTISQLESMLEKDKGKFKKWTETPYQYFNDEIWQIIKSKI